MQFKLMVTVLSPILIQNELMAFSLQFWVIVTTLQLSLPPSSAGNLNCRTSDTRWMWTCSFLKHVSIWAQLDLPLPRVHLTAQHISHIALTTNANWAQAQLAEVVEHWPLGAFCMVPCKSTRNSRYRSQQPCMLYMLYTYTLCLVLENITLVYSQAFANLQAGFPSQEDELVHQWLPAGRPLAPSG